MPPRSTSHGSWRKLDITSFFGIWALNRYYHYTKDGNFIEEVWYRNNGLGWEQWAKTLNPASSIYEPWVCQS